MQIPSAILHIQKPHVPLFIHRVQRRASPAQTLHPHLIRFHRPYPVLTFIDNTSQHVKYKIHSFYFFCGKKKGKAVIATAVPPPRDNLAKTAATYRADRTRPEPAEGLQIERQRLAKAQGESPRALSTDKAHSTAQHSD